MQFAAARPRWRGHRRGRAGRGAVRLAIVSGMRTLGDDIVLLALRPDGRLAAAAKLRFALSGSELVGLAEARRVEVDSDRIIVLDPSPTGDPLLDAALDDLIGQRRPPSAKRWVARERPGLVGRYLQRLSEAGVVRAERHKVLGFLPSPRWPVVDLARAAEARQRLDALAASRESQDPLEPTRAALGALVHAIGLDAVLYPGPDGRPARQRLKQIARVAPAAGPVQDALHDAQEAARAGVDAATDAAVRAATEAAIHASVQAAHHAAQQSGHSGGGGGHH
jgi:Golgi phosphoprotein 3 (GPP34)